ncbi:MAG: hypothetical protein Q9166_004733 [cf. Caloplaca sp. 2 TL-2023]
MPDDRKRQRDPTQPTSNLRALPTPKRQKPEHKQQEELLCSFWDNLSRLVLTPRALREFDRRTIWPVHPAQPNRTESEHIDLTLIKDFVADGGPSLEDLRAFPESKKAAVDRDVSSHPTMAQSHHTSAYSGNFELHLIDHGVYPEGFNDDHGLQEPNNVAEIRTRLANRRASLSETTFTQEQFQDFKKKNLNALNEDTVKANVITCITGTAEIPSQRDMLFTNLEPLTDGSLVKPEPDMFDGVQTDHLHEYVRGDLGPFIVPTKQSLAPSLLNFFLEVKGPDGAENVAKRQALYDGAVGARGIHRLRSYIEPTTLDNNMAYTITSTYHPTNGVLVLYCTHLTRSSNPIRRYDYRMTALAGFIMVMDSQSFRQGAAALRNARDWAMEQRGLLVDAANCKAANTRPLDLPACTESWTQQSITNTHAECSDSSADELAGDGTSN